MGKTLNISISFVLLNFLLESRGSQQANVGWSQIYFSTKKALNFSLSSLFPPEQTIKGYRVQRAYDCQPENASYPVKVTGMMGIVVNETLSFTGKIHILELMPMNIELELGLTRCNIDKTGCNAFDRMIFPRICEKMGTKTSVAYKITKGISPTPSCPFAIGVYELTNNSSMALDIFKMLPIEGYLWKLQCAFFEKKGPKRVRPIACVEYEVTVVIKSRRPRKN